jgi:hypothetical protein
MPNLKLTTIAIALAAACAGPVPGDWFQGTTHTHTLNSDGDSTPDDVVRWYREHGYDFVFITDHGMVTNIEPLNALFGGGGQFLVLPAEEVTSNSKTPELHVHVNALNPNGKIKAQKGTGARDTLQMDLDAVSAAGGLAQINHPNFFWQLTANDIANVNGATFMEIANMQPDVNSFGAGPDAPGTEEIWDQVLSRGKAIWGTASDDAHDFKDKMPPDPKWPLAKPGGGWIMVRAEHLTLDDIMKSLRAGDFYASTGVILKDYQVSGKQISIQVAPREAYREKYRIQFIGKNGKILQDKTAESATYAIKGDEGYVRSRITSSNGGFAWTQPVFTDGRKLP